MICSKADGSSKQVDLGVVGRGRQVLYYHTQAEMRSMAIRMYRSTGKPMGEIARTFGISVPTAYRWARVPVPCFSDALSPRD